MTYQYQTKSFIELALEKTIIVGVLLVASGILVLLASALLNPTFMIRSVGISFPVIFAGIGLISIAEKILSHI